VSDTPRILITGISGQDGSYLAELLCADAADVHGTIRGPIDGEVPNLGAVRDQVELHRLDLAESGRLRALIAELQPDHIYHLAAPAFVPAAWDTLAETVRAIAGSGAELLEAVREHCPEARVVVAGSREIFGSDAPSPQDEASPCIPTSPYGVAKLAVHQLVSLARRRDDLHASSAILYNHESPRRAEAFVTRKVTRAAAAIKLGLAQELVLGDIAAVRDWSAARDIVRGLRAMALADEPDDYILASGSGRKVRELVDTAFAAAGLDVAPYLRIDQRFVRPPELSEPIGNPRRAASALGWSVEIGFEEMIDEMVQVDLELLGAELTPQ
jgi:GDPmannose 4,6-dehydratase